MFKFYGKWVKIGYDLIEGIVKMEVVVIIFEVS